MPRERRNLLAGTHMTRNIILLAAGPLLALAGMSYLFQLDGLALLLLITSADRAQAVRRWRRGRFWVEAFIGKLLKMRT